MLALRTGTGIAMLAVHTISLSGWIASNVVPQKEEEERRERTVKRIDRVPAPVLVLARSRQGSLAVTLGQGRSFTASVSG